MIVGQVALYVADMYEAWQCWDFITANSPHPHRMLGLQCWIILFVLFKECKPINSKHELRLNILILDPKFPHTWP